MQVDARELEEAVLDIIRKQAEAVLGSAEISGFRKMSAEARQIEDCEGQIREYTMRRQQCYERFLNREIDRNTLYAMKTDYTARIERLENQLAILKQAERDKEAGAKAAVIAKEALSETSTNRGIIEALVDRIHVSPGARIQIHWKVANFAENV
jgi:chemotaxis protein histidine kinase CheA